MIRSVVLCLALLAGGCATVPPAVEAPAGEAGWQRHEAALAGLKRWQLSGRLAIQTEKDSWSGSIRWNQDHEFYQIDFAGPFGQGASSLTGDLRRVVLKTPDGEIVGLDGPEALLRERLGWQFPLSELQWWIIGLPSPERSIERRQLDEAGRLAQLQQSDWSIDYRRYQPVGALALPEKIVIRHDHLGLKLIIDEWSLDPAPQS
ncbi:MAG: lipoprotein insertase outer membrane protein LolB [Pseudomonadota bacterium]